MAKHTLDILWYENREMFKVCLFNFQYFAWKDQKGIKVLRIILESIINP